MLKIPWVHLGKCLHTINPIAFRMAKTLWSLAVLSAIGLKVTYSENLGIKLLNNFSPAAYTHYLRIL